MAKKKTSQKKRRKRKSAARATVPKPLKLLAAVMLVIALAGVVTVKLFRTTGGRVVLLDFGVSGYYAQLQGEIDAPLRAAVGDIGPLAGFDERVEVFRKNNERYLIREWDIACADCRLVDVNLAFTKAVKGAGGIVRSGVETGDREEGTTQLIFEAGSRTLPTHRISVRRAPAPRPVAAVRPARPKLALIIDDFGYARTKVVESFFELDLPITIAVIPALPNSRYAITRAREAGKEPILHLPMEAEEWYSEVEAVETTMTDAEIESLLERYIRDYPGVIGVNNHMGSIATQDARVMERVIAVLKMHDLFYLDSLTSPKSIAYTTAKENGLPAARNDLFLDDDTEEEHVVEERLWQLVDIARQNGFAIGIGHPKAWTYGALVHNLPMLKESGIDFVFLSDLVE